jgi:hypothetical protein
MVFKLDERKIYEKWRLPFDWEVDDNGKWIHDTNWQKHRLRLLKIKNIINV